METTSAGKRWQYPVLFGTQTIGATILIWFAIPHYRGILANPSAHEAELATLVWSLPAIALMQGGYWTRFRLVPPQPRFVNAALGHVVQCLARFGFIFASSVFSFLFLVPNPAFSMPIGRYVITTLMMFAVFCYTLELERLGRTLLGPEPKPSH